MVEWEYLSNEEMKEIERKEQLKPVRNAACYRVAAVNARRTCYLYYKDTCVGSLTEEKNPADETDWVFKIYWDAYDRVGQPYIMAVDTDLRLDEYVINILPYFVYARTKSDRYEGLEEDLARVGMKYNDKFEFMLRTRGNCSRDDIRVYPTPDMQFNEDLTPKEPYMGMTDFFTR